MARLFVAVWPPGEVVDLLRALPRPDEPGVRWVRPEHWHVTLRFLGEADVDAAADALARLRAPAVRATLGPAVSRLGRSVVCVPVGGLEPVAAAVVAATAAVGDPPDPRPFNGHITLARLRRRGACRVAGARVSARFPVDRVTLVRSESVPDGQRYTIELAVPLEG